MNPDFCYETARLGEVLCTGVIDVSEADILRFRCLMGYGDSTSKKVAPPSMCLTYGLKLGWEHAIFPPGVVRMGDAAEFGEPARAGDQLTTSFSIIEKFERKEKRFLRYEMRTVNQKNEMVCAIVVVGLRPSNTKAQIS